MIAFLDSSVVLRKLFGEPNPVEEWSSIRDAYVSRILAVEVGRVIDRCRLDGKIDDEQVAVLTHDRRLGRAARASGLAVSGI
ncbi:MAG TPA: hypothetical protein VHE30_19585 [Polyangiaceae bacterium]|nr:hypothetical protein [Polyangiaceae bacterium]